MLLSLGKYSLIIMDMKVMDMVGEGYKDITL